MGISLTNVKLNVLVSLLNLDYKSCLLRQRYEKKQYLEQKSAFFCEYIKIG